jgi:hypothetical protein
VPTAVPTPTPTAQAGRSVVAAPVEGQVLVRRGPRERFAPLALSEVRNGAELDARAGTVEITRADGGRARFYDGIFTLTQSGGLTTLTLSERLTGCPKARRAGADAGAAAKKPKSRKLWGDGKGKFRTRGEYASATVRGTRWLVQDTCTSTVVRVREGVVSARDEVKRRTVVLRKGRSYTARARR